VLERLLVCADKALHDGEVAEHESDWVLAPLPEASEPPCGNQRSRTTDARAPRGRRSAGR
jgi:hypothetical protein